MASRHDIITLPHKRLRDSSQTVDKVDEKILQLIEDMKQATLDWEDSREHEFGVALAAVQIDQPYRVIVVRGDLEDKENRAFNVYINPEITRYDGEPEFDLEGCLSVKDIYGKVPRYPKVKIQALNEEGDRVKFVAKNFMARMFQHEVDHTNGITFVDRLGNEAPYFRLEADGEMTEITSSEHAKLVKELCINGAS